MASIYQNLPFALPDECVDVLLTHQNVRIERIVSQGHSTPVGEWYDQTENEWVIVLQGLGVIEYDNGERITLNTGDYLYLPAHLKHRVASTSEHEQT
ncbi:MAG: cupin domain-containing protein, partial [Methylococcaceae bacterium]